MDWPYFHTHSLHWKTAELFPAWPNTTWDWIEMIFVIACSL
ncbi:hypothetical protein JCM19241_1110 [Vibrio ishigakensis]|nr:hypothetical protein JCM19241_1110 [Vibrio ishigakensis]